MSARQKPTGWPLWVLIVLVITTVAFARGRLRAISNPTLTAVPETKTSNSKAGSGQTGNSQAGRSNPRARNLSLQPGAFNLGRRVGQRFSSSQREQSVLLGTLTTGTEQRGVNITRKQTDNGEQVEINLAGSRGLLSWDAETGPLSSGARATGSERELIERLVLDSPDQFVLAQLRGASYYTVARNVRPAEEASDGYTGALWDIVRIDDPQRDAERKPESSWRLYYINARTGVIDKIVSELRGERIEAVFSDWREENGRKVPGRITWMRQGQELMQYRLTSFSPGQQTQ